MVGYAGGTTESPTYDSIGNHSETLQVVFDPDKVGYNELLEIFWEGHDPASRPYSTQYKAILFYHNERQKRLAEESKAKLEKHLGRTVFTEIRPFSSFTRAEDYHQKYSLRGSAVLFKEVRSRFASDKEFVDSTLAARINGFLGSDAPSEDIRRAAAEYDLSAAAKKILLK